MRKFVYRQTFKTFEGCRKRCQFERAHAGDRGNVNYRFFPVRCRNGVIDVLPYDSKVTYNYRIERTLSDDPTDPRLLVGM
jgi:hypothetical protein